MNNEHPIRAFRLSLGMTQRAFAALIGCTQSAVSNWEVGIRLPRKAASRILKLAQDNGYQFPIESFIEQPEPPAHKQPGRAA